MSNQLTTLNNEEKQEALVPINASTESSRVIQEVQAALIIAKKFPRDETAAFKRIMTSCKRLTLANQAIYNLPISGRNQTGPSIRLAEVLAQAWGNMKFGVNELSRVEGVSSSCVAFCWDQETNTNSEIAFEVDHFIMARGAKKYIVDPAEIDRLIASRGARKLRQCILKVIPPDIVEEAMNQCKNTIKNGDGSPLSDRVRKLVVWFGSYQVTQEMIEKRLGHSVDTIDGEEYLDLTAIATAMKDGQGKRSTFFPTDEDDKPKTSSLNDLLKTEKKPETASISDANAEPPPKKEVKK
jgi:hypothetical protein